MSTLSWLIFIWASGSTIAQVADPVSPIYDLSKVPSQFEKSFPISDAATINDLVNGVAVGYHEHACLRGTKNTGDSTNRIIFNFPKDAIRNLRNGTNFLFNGTYWYNEFLHVGHVMYDLVLMQLLQTVKIDRIVLQRPICQKALCSGIGVFDSFYLGYFTALLEAAGRTDVPVYLRFTDTPEVKPFYFSSSAPDYYMNDKGIADPEKRKPILLEQIMCFEKLYRRTDTKFGAIPTLSAKAVHNFKEAAYKLLRSGSVVHTYFERERPYVILFSYRGPKASRYISNMGEIENKLRATFPAPIYEVRMLNNSDSSLSFQTQMRAVAEAHVVITNHGAFEGNMLYMKNQAMLVEIFGHYGNNEIHQFHRMALSLGLYYARVQSKALDSHQGKSFEMSAEDIGGVIDTVTTYFVKKPFEINTK